MFVHVRVFYSRLTAWFSPRGDAEFDHELETHLALLIEGFVARGLTQKEAAFAARRQFGGIEQLKQARRELRNFRLVEEFFADARHAIRALAKTPVFTATVLAALTLGMGANTAIFSLVNAVMLKPLKAPDVDRIVRFLNTNDYGMSPIAGFPQFNVWRQQTTLIEEISAHRMDIVNLTGGPYPEQIPVARVSDGFFRLFGVPLLYGRTFTSAEDRPGSARVAVLGHELWTRRFGGNPNAVGQSIVLGTEPYTVIGILAPNFDTEQFDTVPAAWVPLQIDPNTTEQGSYCTVTGRLKRGVTLETANEELRTLAEEYRGMITDGNPTAKFMVHKLQNAMAASLLPSFVLLASTVALVLLIACVNAANLFLVRSNGRRHEMAIRAAVGAGRGRIIRQLLTESVMLSLTGGALGLAFGLIGIREILSFNPVSIPRLGAHGTAISVDWRLICFTLAVSFVAGLLFGLVPALTASRGNLTNVLKESDGRYSSGSYENSVRSALIVGEVALASLLLIGSALLIRSYVALRSVQPGFETHNVLTTQMSLSATRFERTAEMNRLVLDGVRGIRSLPGVETAGAACCVPLETVWQLSFMIESRKLGRQVHGFAGWTFVSPEYFDALKIPILRGRGFTKDDNADTSSVVIINQAMAKQFWPDSDPLKERLIIGKYVRPEYDSDSARQIVGIIGDVRDTRLGAAPRPAMYVPIAQLPDAINAINLRLLPLAWFIRVNEPAPSLGSAIQSELRQASGGLPATETRWMDEVSAESTALTEFSTLLITIFGSLALALASIGIYGLIAYSVQQRTHEICIRIAVGAGKDQVRNMIVRQGMQLTLVGVGIGVVAAFALTQLLTRFLFGVRAHDAMVFLAVPLAISSLALLAVWIPARRVNRVDPVYALKCQ